MTVHIGEVHSEVTPVDGSRGRPEDTGRAAAPWAAQEAWAEARRRAECLKAHVAAVGFDD